MPRWDRSCVMQMQKPRCKVIFESYIMAVIILAIWKVLSLGPFFFFFVRAHKCASGLKQRAACVRGCSFRNDIPTRAVCVYLYDVESRREMTTTQCQKPPLLPPCGPTPLYT